MMSDKKKPTDEESTGASLARWMELHHDSLSEEEARELDEAFDELATLRSRLEGRFTLEYWPEGEGLVGRLVEVPGVASQGASLDELERNISDAYRLVVAEARTAMRQGSETVMVYLGA